jgi:hypothetical protein
MERGKAEGERGIAKVKRCTALKDEHCKLEWNKLTIYHKTKSALHLGVESFTISHPPVVLTVFRCQLTTYFHYN